MTDILERLRTAASLAQALPACREGADEIERLRKFARYIMNEGDHVSRWVMGDKAREALSLSSQNHNHEAK